jgi:hypothetical protein
MTDAEKETLKSLANSLDKLSKHIRFCSETLRTLAASNDNIKKSFGIINK